MKSTTRIRKKLGISQQQLAEWLGISRSLLALHETHKRDLPTAALVKLGKLEIMMFNMQKEKSQASYGKYEHPESVQRHAKARQAMVNQIKECEYQLIKMNSQLKTMIKMHAQTIQWLEVIKALTASTAADKKNRRDGLWLEIQYGEASKKLVSCDEAAQLGLEVKIDAMEAVAAIHRRKVEELSNIVS